MSTTKTLPTGPDTGLDGYFEITKRGSTVGREIRGGLVTFFTMAYIIALNPIIIGTSPDINGNLVSGLPISDGANIPITMGMVAAGTAFIAGVLTLLMGVIGRFPLALAAGLGLNAMLAYGLVKSMTWPQAMGLIVWEGVIILVLVLTGFREAVFRAVPRPLRSAISIGIGLFIAFVGLVDARIIRPGSPIVQLGGSGSLLGWPALVFVVGLLLTIVLYIRRVKGAILISILTATVLAIAIEAFIKVGPNLGADGKVANPEGWALNVPQFTSLVALPDLGLLGRFDLVGAFATGPQGFILALMSVFALLLADFFDTMGTVVAVGAEGDLLEENGNPPRTREIFIVDSVAALAGGLGSVSSNTSYIESAAGVGEGARTGLASVVTGVAFLLSMFLAPVVNMVPSEAVAPALVFVGFLMMGEALHIDWQDPEEGLPAFLAMILMPFTYSITAGIGAGFLFFVLLKAVRGKAGQVHPLMWGVAAAFCIYFGQGIIGHLVQ